MPLNALDSMKYAVAEAENTIGWALDAISGAEHMTDALDTELEPILECLRDLVTHQRASLAPHVKDREDWFTYSDGRPLETHVSVGSYSWTHLWQPDPRAEAPISREIEIPTGLEDPEFRAATLSHELPSKMVIRIGDEVIAESGYGDADVIAALDVEPNEDRLRRHISDLADIEAMTGKPHNLASSPSIEQLRQHVAKIEKARESQPERIFDLRTQIIIERDKAQQDEPWSSFVTDIPAYTRDGYEAGSMGIPNLEAKEMFGMRLALELSAEAGDEDDVRDTINDYFSMIREPDQMMLIAMSALSHLGTMILPAMFKVIEETAGNWDMRVHFADTARHTWTKRLADFNAEDAESA
ncbi:hypothetical protein ACIGKR_09060 [Rhodococcus qingshengii]|uniref:hypothetical protein n=1 Tax=Rhodococcus qingshengii TaxID=334542 RepID=UPI0037CA9124